MATNVLGLMDYVQQQGEKGRQQGQQQRFNQLAGQAYAAPAAQQGALVGQAVGIDPTAGVALGNTLASRNQAVEADHVKKVGGAARYMAQALESKNPQQIQGAWSAVRPYLTELTGKQAPEQWDPSFAPGVYQAIAMTGGAPDVKGVVVAPGSVLANPATGASLLSNPALQQYQNVPTGTGTVAGMVDRQAGTVRPAIPGMAPGVPAQGDPMQPLIDQANAAIRMGAPEDKVRAWLLEQAQAAGLQPQPAGQAAPEGGNQFQTTPAIVPGPSAAPAQFGIGTPAPTAADRPPAGYQWNADHSNLQPIPGGPADKGSAVGLGDPNATGDSYLQTIPDDGMRNLIKSIAEGRMQVPRIYRSSKAGEIGATEIAAAVAQYDPSFNAQDFNSRNRTRIAFTSGKPYQDMTALNQVAQHIGHLAQQIDGTSGVALPLGLGTLVNRGVNAASDPYTGKVTAYQSTADAVAHETRKLFAGSSGGTLAELQSYIDMLKADNSYAQKKAALQNIAQLVQSRIGILRQGYEQGMGKAGDPFATTFPESARLLQEVAGDDAGTPQSAQQPPSPTPTASRPRATNPQTGETVEFDGQQWVPVHG